MLVNVMDYFRFLSVVPELPLAAVYPQILLEPEILASAIARLTSPRQTAATVAILKIVMELPHLLNAIASILMYLLGIP